jgi:hypothetical protein
VVANSRFLILPSLAVPNLGSHVLALAAARGGGLAKALRLYARAVGDLRR